MAKTSWKDIAELIGIAAIVASLVFVGLQMKQSQEIAIASQYQARADAANAFQFALIEAGSAELGKAVLIQGKSGAWPPEVLTWMEQQSPEDLARRSLMLDAILTLIDNNYFQYQAGLLDEESWIAFRSRLKRALSDPVNRAMYANGKESWPLRFQLVADKVITEIESGESGQR